MNVGNDTYIRWLGEAGCDDRALVGGKVAHLSKLAQTHNVPAGFCLTTAACDLVTARGLALEGSSEAKPEMPAHLMEAITAAYRQLARSCTEAEPAVAVRSSAVDEDGLVASFAGQYETFLNVVGVENVAMSVRRCWASVNSARAIEYRRQRRLKANGGQVAVLVQRLIVADVAAVAFSANPVTGHRDEVVVNANWGLGESVVGGTVTPDTYVVRKADLAIVSRQIGDKRRMAVAVPGGAREVGVPLFLRLRSSLEDAQIAEIARLALALEDTMGWPADVECAYRAGQLYLLQCRPVTTFKLEEKLEERNGEC